MACNVFIISSADIRLQTKIFSEQKIYRSNWKSHTRYTLIAFFCLSLLACWFNVSFPSYLTTYDLRHNTQQAWPGSSSWASPSLCVSISSQDLQFLNLCFFMRWSTRFTCLYIVTQILLSISVISLHSACNSSDNPAYAGSTINFQKKYSYTDHVRMTDDGKYD